MSAYRTAIDQTTKTIDTRARYFRNMVVAVVAIGLGSIIWAVVSLSLAPLVAVLLLLPTCGLFFFLDAKLLEAWRSQLLEAWVRKDVDLRAFGDAVKAVPGLPQETISGMLATLPDAGDLLSEQRISPATREMVAAAAATIHKCQSDGIALKTAAATVASGSVVIALALRRWEPVLGNAAVSLLPFAASRLKRRSMEAFERKTAAAQARPDSSSEKYRELAARLPWNSVSNGNRGRMLRLSRDKKQ